MSDLFRNTLQVRVLRRRALRECFTAVAHLGGAASGRRRFGTDHGLRAAVALARLAPLLMGEQDDEPLDDEYWAPSARRLSTNSSPRQPPRNAPIRVAQAFLRDGPDNKYSTIEEAREYGRRLWRHCEGSSERNRRALGLKIKHH